ncbi:MAG: hypothetical protein K2Z81_20410, partial [Cyanobacteria bacterium]|nr:hypothetical protein [Cyanobacteriota bacterium]
MINSATQAAPEPHFESLSLPLMNGRLSFILTNLVLLAIAIFTSLIGWSSVCPNEAAAETLFRRSPRQSTLQYFATHRTGKERLLNDGNTGDWMILHQAGPVFVDTRFVFYGKKFFTEWCDCLDDMPGWRS